ncbi:hypothetical protein A8C56_06870 [Niabella ginsenosidivorans]|uniref:DUF3823 domain-containing protein n=1 Tax=Niabella ginsenosidivorans TaxID=1176587 RepID=A0A1A9HZC8_9BACT|nr:DUF3823 domain-containing protein [Niabella ginsenosidivorans]ANH80736.1 hypothetical protein A8C56_06870 [Niabella ginsenosidivorans]
MKKLIVYLAACSLFICVLISCKKDNYDPPKIQLTGQLLYNGDSVYVEYGQVSFQLHQHGYSTPAPIEETFNQNGTLSMLLFPGDYKLVIPDGQGPFLWKHTAAGTPDTLDVDLTQNTSIEIPVTPYYMIRNLQITNNGSSVTAHFALEKIITGENARDVDAVALYINKTQFVSQTDDGKIAGASETAIADPGNIALSVAIPSITPAQNYVFARVGVKISGVEDMLYSKVVKINF